MESIFYIFFVLVNINTDLLIIISWNVVVKKKYQNESNVYALYNGLKWMKMAWQNINYI